MPHRFLITGQPIDPQKLQRAKELRKTMTPMEAKLWAQLRRNQLGYHFRRQQVIYGFIVDFLCNEVGLVVEVDGEVHEAEEQTQYDEARDQVLVGYDVQVLRFTNDQIKHELPKVLEVIRQTCMVRAAQD